MFTKQNYLQTLSGPAATKQELLISDWVYKKQVSKRLVPHLSEFPAGAVLQ
jgi:hypothetical protein